VAAAAAAAREAAAVVEVAVAAENAGNHALPRVEQHGRRSDRSGGLTTNNSNEPVDGAESPQRALLLCTLATQFSPSYAANMEKKRLLETLDALRAEVAQASEVDPELRAELRRLTDELRQTIDDREQVAATEDEQAPHGLKDLLLRFEADHPQLSVSVGKVADALAAMGF
jgi:hypothetical protein